MVRMRVTGCGDERCNHAAEFSCDLACSEVRSQDDISGR
jgi:hypothetical protein